MLFVLRRGNQYEAKMFQKSKYYEEAEKGSGSYSHERTPTLAGQSE